MSGANHPTAETFDRRRFEQAPCYICGYNGAGYYHSGLHRCAALYHGYKLPQEAPLTSNSVALLVKRMRSLADLASHKEPAISEALIDGVVQIERLERVAGEVEMMALTLDARDREIDRLHAALERIRDYPSTARHVSDIRTWAEMSDIAREALSGEHPPDETAAPQAPIAKVIVREDGPTDVMLYAPGLPPGEHDLYCEPEAVAPMMRDGTKAIQTCPTCGADWYWPTSPSKAGENHGSG